MKKMKLRRLQFLETFEVEKSEIPEKLRLHIFVQDIELDTIIFYFEPLEKLFAILDGDYEELKTFSVEMLKEDDIDFLLEKSSFEETYRQIGSFSSFVELEDFFENLKNNFHMNRFDTFLSLLAPAYYGYHVDLSLSDESSYDCNSHMTIGIRGQANWGTDWKDYSMKYYFSWYTTSFHRVVVVGELHDEHLRDENTGNFEVYVGTDESHVFYETIEFLAQKQSCTDEI